ncbi:MAG TPA: class I SAM-dependent methyltransferase [Kofleriaceae bacterium]|nr:class I SAM-dependent methyltransferase [Kofleriaceae bacterium]
MSAGTDRNVDQQTVDGFGDEWRRFDQAAVSAAEQAALFEQYFAIFPWEALPAGAVGFDLGCGSGRWARQVAPRVGRLHAIDPAREALDVARRNLAGFANVELHLAGVDALPLADGSMDFGYSLGVLHHVPDTARGLRDCVRKLKPGAPFLLYLYYAFDNRPWWFRQVWRASDVARRGISRLPPAARYAATQAIAAGVYWPLARASRALEGLGVDVERIPLSAYRDRSFYVMRNDALDRFGTRLERRFTRAEMAALMRDAGLERITFHDDVPFWTAVGHRRG